MGRGETGMIPLAILGKMQKEKHTRCKFWEQVMGLTTARLILKNPRKPELQPMEVDALADTGSIFLCIPAHVQYQLHLEEIEKREVVIADGTRKSVPYVGPLQLHFKNRTGFFGAIVLGDQVLLGAVPMEDMDLVVIPSSRTVDVNPANPNVACGIVKGGVR
jgi:clan AA aspartic protease